MIGKQLFVEASDLDEALDIVNEIISYAEDIHRTEMLPPEHYDDLLLLSSEVVREVDNWDEWIGLGYKLCQSIKQSMECCQRQTSMYNGLGYRCFAVREFCKQANMLHDFSRSMNRLLFAALDNKVDQVKHDPTRARNYDAINGISGTLYYLLDCEWTQAEKKILRKCIDYLLFLAQDTEFRGRPILRFHVMQPDQDPGLNQNEFKDGSIHFGAAHGMLGPLIALAKAHAMGFTADRLEEGIAELYHLYEIYQYVDQGGIPYWPKAITAEEYWEKTCKPEHLYKPCFWDQGNIGILRGLLKVSAYMNWPEREQEYLEAMKHLLAQDKKTYCLASPSLCCGYSGLLAIQLGTYSVYKDHGLLTNLDRNVKEIINRYRKNVEEHLNDLSMPNGSVGIAAALLLLMGGKTKAGKLLMID